MAKIRMLAEEVIGKIAAGEVVERPAAAIKELVENSLDAGARSVSVEIQEGGIDSFRVTDDGCGIEESDIRLAFERHATSKIRTDSDLDAIGTLGFRGEALASIAAVGRVTMTTRTRDRETGIRVRNEGGQILDISEAACAPGTSIRVQDLFFNVPVRRGFLKKPATEANAVTDLMTRLVLSRPDVRFRYTVNGKMMIHSPGDGKAESAILAVYGPSVVRTLRKVEGRENGILIRGYVGIGENARANRGAESFFINGRMLRSPLLSGALEDACRERVMIGKFPLCVLHLEMPCENVNINVHPNKMEVRFRFDQRVREAVFDIVLDALHDRDAFERPVEMKLEEESGPNAREGQAAAVGAEFPPAASRGTGPVPALPPRGAAVTTGGPLPPVRMRENAPVPVYRPIEGKKPAPESRAVIAPEPLPAPEFRRGEAERIRGATGGFPGNPGKGSGPDLLPDLAPDLPGEAERIRETAGGLPGNPGKDSGLLPELPPDLLPDLAPDLPGETAQDTALEHFSAPARNPATTAEETAEQLNMLPKDDPLPMKVFGAVFNTFILIEYADHLLLVDQHAVHERLLFVRMMKAWQEQRAGQEMLVPAIVPVTAKDMAVLEENQELLEGLGLRAEPFSATEVAVRSVPVLLGQNETPAFLREALDELENGRIPGEDKKRAAILQAACKHAVKGGEKLTDEVLRSLVEEMIDRKVTPTCPHGRPLVVSIPHAELDRKFKRIQG